MTSRTPLGAIALLFAMSACSEFRTGPIAADGSDDADAIDDGSQPDAQCGMALGTCNLVTGDGCPSNNCVLVISGDAGTTSARCQVPGTGAFGSRCSSAGACAAGLVCLDHQCRRLCCDSSDCVGAGLPGGLMCDETLSFGAAAGLHACREQCGWNPNDCIGDLTCIPLNAAGTSDCYAAGTGGDGAICHDQTDCMTGFICLGMATGTDGTCQQICTDLVTSCPGTEMCQQVVDAPTNFLVCY